MDWQAFQLSVLLGLLTAIVLIPLAVLLARALAYRRFPGRSVIEALVALPLVLPPTVIGFYFLQAFGAQSWLGQQLAALNLPPLVFSIEGLLLASVLINVPFAVQPIMNALQAIPASVREAAQCCGLGSWALLWRVELPLAWPGLVTAFVLTFAHTLGEFGVVLMVGGSIAGETRTLSIAIYDRVQAFDDAGAGLMAAVLLAFAVAALALTHWLARRDARR